MLLRQIQSLRTEIDQLRMALEKAELMYGYNASRAARSIQRYEAVLLPHTRDSTLIAARLVGRKAFLLELDPLDCDVIVQRFEKFAGKRRNGSRAKCGAPRNGSIENNDLTMRG
jgi:hypothetical protein